MAIEFEEQGPPATEAEIEEAEAQLGLTLPLAYKDFLRARNGAIPAPNQLDDADVSIKVFYGVGGSALGGFDDSDLVSHRQVFAGRTPATILPIADSAMGDLVCIGVGDDVEGQIFHWFHEEEADIGIGEPPTWENLTLVAPDLATLLERLQPPDRSNLPICRTRRSGCDRGHSSA